MLAVDIYLLVLSALFAAQTFPILGELLPLLAQPEFEPMRAFVSSREGFVGSWNHMILGDLWIGRWIAQDSLQSKHPLIVRLLILPFVLFFGPLGLFLYLVYRIISRRSFRISPPLEKGS